MPGVSIVIENELAEKESDLSRVLKSLNHLEYFESKQFYYQDNFFIGWNTYKDYPISNFSYSNFEIIIEGRIYDRTESETKTDLKYLVDSISDDRFQIEVTKWIESVDGDFLIYLFDKRNEKLFVFNDVFGRLPLYYKKSSNRICISRYLKFITDFENDYEFDTIALSQFLLLGYMLGERTIFGKINHLRPASLLVVDKDTLKVSTLRQFNFDNRKHVDKDLKTNLAELDRLFSDACKNRFETGKQNIVTLSGGLDSRMVAACMFRNNIPFDTATIAYSSGYASEEIEIAQKLADLFKSKFNLLNIDPPKGADVHEQLLIKEGMNSLATAPIIPFYKKIAESFGRDINFITGDNGDKLIFTIDKPFIKFKDLDHLVDHIIEEHSVIPISSVTSILGTNTELIKNEIKSVLLSFPEDNLVQKYIHFRIIEKPFKYAYQGEDRHRFYFWSLTPFWSTHFFTYIMNCSDESKIKHRLFGGLIKRFSPEAIMLKYTNFKSSITSIKGKLAMFLIYNVYPYIPLRLRGDFKTIFFGGNPLIERDSVLSKCLLEQKKNTPEISNYINFTEVARLKNLRKIILFNILTVSSAIEYFTNKRSTLTNYSNVEF